MMSFFCFTNVEDMHPLIPFNSDSSRVVAQVPRVEGDEGRRRLREAVDLPGADQDAQDKRGRRE